MAYMWTKFDDCSFSRSSVMIGGPNIQNWSHDHDHAIWGTVCCPKANTSRVFKGEGAKKYKLNIIGHVTITMPV